jgi:hypothetical protein
MIKCLIAAVNSVVLLLVASQGPRGMPADVLGYARQSPVAFALALAAASVPSGLELKESDDVMPDRPPSHSGTQPTVPAIEVIRAFNSAHADYQATLIDTTVVIRPLKGRASFLDAPSPILTTARITGAMAAARQVFSALNPSLRTSVALNSIGHEGDDNVIVLPGGGRTVIETLNQIVAQSDLRTWVTTTRRREADVEVISFGFIERRGGRRVQAISPP